VVACRARRKALESLTVRFESSDQPVLFCYLEDVYDGGQLRPERLQAWEQLRARYGDGNTGTALNESVRRVAAVARTL
jgi:hypothetical protein